MKAPMLDAVHFGSGNRMVSEKIKVMNINEMYVRNLVLHNQHRFDFVFQRRVLQLE